MQQRWICNETAHIAISWVFFQGYLNVTHFKEHQTGQPSKWCLPRKSARKLWTMSVDPFAPPPHSYNIFNVVIWYRESSISLGECVISCNCYLIWRILYPRKGKCDQWQDCYQLKHPPLIWRILLSDPHFKPFNLDLYNIYSLFDMVDLWNIFIPWE